MVARVFSGKKRPKLQNVGTVRRVFGSCNYPESQEQGHKKNGKKY
jgi:hypothetical protein